MLFVLLIVILQILKIEYVSIYFEMFVNDAARTDLMLGDRTPIKCEGKEKKSESYFIGLVIKLTVNVAKCSYSKCGQTTFHRKPNRHISMQAKK